MRPVLPHATRRAPAVLFLSSALLCGCEGGDGPDLSDTGAPGLSFAGLLFAVANDSTTATVHWAPASNGEDDPADLVYEVILGASEADLDAAPTLTVVGETSAVLTGLTQGSAYYATVVASDRAGDMVVAPVPVFWTTPEADPLVAEVPVDLQDLGFEVVGEDGDTVVLDGGDGNELAAGDLVVLPTVEAALRRVLAVRDDGDRVELDTEVATLADAAPAYQLASSVVLADLSALEGDGLQVGRMRSRGAFASDDGSITWVPDDAALPVRAGTAKFSNEATLDYTLDFTPRFDVFATRGDNYVLPEQVRMTASGELELDAVARWILGGKVDVDEERTLVSRTLRLRYLVGGVPVLQEVKLELVGALVLHADATLTTTATAKLRKTLRFGFQWHEDSGWSVISDQGFTNNVAVDLSAQGSFTGSLTITPRVSTSFYRSISGTLEVVPSLSIAAAARLSPAPAQFTRFDVDLDVDAKVAGSVGVFGYDIGSWTGSASLLDTKIHSLPVLAWTDERSTLTRSGETTLKVGVTQGANNIVDTSALDWSATGDGTVVGSGETGVVTTTADQGTVVITVAGAGDGFLGTLGTQYLTKEYPIGGVPHRLPNSDFDNTSKTVGDLLCPAGEVVVAVHTKDGWWADTAWDWADGFEISCADALTGAGAHRVAWPDNTDVHVPGDRGTWHDASCAAGDVARGLVYRDLGTSPPDDDYADGASPLCVPHDGLDAAGSAPANPDIDGGAGALHQLVCPAGESMVGIAYADCSGGCDPADAITAWCSL